MKNNKKITITTFVEGYNKLNADTAKVNYIKNIIKRTYCPLLEKKVVLQLFLDQSTVTQDNGIKYIDMFLSRINFISSIIVLYTNLEMEKDDKNRPDTFKMYDLLKQADLINLICGLIGETEMKELADIYQCLLDTFSNKNSFETLLCDQFMKLKELITLLSSSNMSVLEEIEKKGFLDSLFENAK